MSSIDKEEVARLADLARIALTDEELERLSEELRVVSEAVIKVNQILTPDIPRTSHPIPLTNVLREDEVVPGLDLDEVFAMAPSHEDGKFAVPQILGEE